MCSGPPMEALAVVVQALGEEDVGALADGDLRTRLLDLARAITLMQAELTRSVDVFDSRKLHVADACRSTHSWLRNFTRLSESAAGDHVRGARALRHLPNLAQASRDGQLSADHLRHITRLVQRVGVEPVARAEPVLVEAAMRLDPADFAQVCHRIRAHVDPDGDAADAAKDFDRRYFTVTPFDGMVLLRGQLDPEGGAALITALDALTPPPSGDDPRDAQQRRADALTQLARGALTEGRLPVVGGMRPQVGVLVTPAQLIGGSADTAGNSTGAMSPDDVPPDAAPPGAAVSPDAQPFFAQPCDAQPCDAQPSDAQPPDAQPPDAQPPDAQPPDAQPPDAQPRGTQPSGIQGHGSASRQTNRSVGSLRDVVSDFGMPWLNWVGDVATPVAQRVACDADIWRVILDPATGQPVDVGRTHRLVPHWIRKALLARDRGCRFPGCRAPAAWTHAHHLRHWAHGGPTDLSNLASLCPFHHVLVHEQGWTIRLNAETGEVSATRPDGVPYEIRDHRIGLGPIARTG